ncbi:MAG: hypothetical protein ACR2FP_10975 [Nocardioidaceae bacterium]
MGPGLKSTEIEPATVVAADTQATTRHRGDGRWPSGKSRIKKVPIKPIAGTQIQSSLAPMSSGFGSEPGLVTTAYRT